ncbi:hypothetical protein [Amycolatopsis benzoatilytica]|uniref:hypothetical protein n=1 Tax=Amycolatopsis benzoatilytica TaxID=346045 RepID=UPI00036ED769|nr:hypothetical protein [Amycolatopsis benzoatilytica]
MKRRTAIVAAAGISLGLVAGSSALAFGTDLLGAREGSSPGTLPPVVNSQTAAGTSNKQPTAAPRPATAPGDEADTGKHEDRHEPAGPLSGHDADD